MNAGILHFLRNRCRNFKKTFNITVQRNTRIRQRLVDIALEKLRLQDEIWHYTDLNSSLSSEIKELQRKLASLHNENHCSNENANIGNLEPKRLHGLDSDRIHKLSLRNQDLNKVETNKIESQGKERAEENTSGKLSLRNDAGSTTTTSTTTAGISSRDIIAQCKEVPQECRTS
uniref:Uncharacterized protein n=1 Tax=Trichobilharzia regenti TaxID=157069 RepID=A0AA85J8S7_TRIRE|nr:unnamed protein product [Trichobilharzia regenti]